MKQGMYVIQESDTKEPGLQRLSQKQLIEIILRKDDLERRLRADIDELLEENRRLSELLDEVEEQN